MATNAPPSVDEPTSADSKTDSADAQRSIETDTSENNEMPLNQTHKSALEHQNYLIGVKWWQPSVKDDLVENEDLDYPKPIKKSNIKLPSDSAISKADEEYKTVASEACRLPDRVMQRLKDHLTTVEASEEEDRLRKSRLIDDSITEAKARARDMHSMM